MTLATMPDWWIDHVRRGNAELEAFLDRTPQLKVAVESEPVQRDLAAHPLTEWGSTEATIRLHKKLGVTEPWDEWEWPRRIAASRAHYRRALSRIEGPPQQELALVSPSTDLDTPEGK